MRGCRASLPAGVPASQLTAAGSLQPEPSQTGQQRTKHPRHLLLILLLQGAAALSTAKFSEHLFNVGAKEAQGGIVCAEPGVGLGDSLPAPDILC